MAITAEQVKALREKTGAGMMECKAALTETGGNMDEAVTVLRKRGLAQAAKRAGRNTSQGLVSSYIHMGGKIGVLVEINCESDFVARTEGFQQLVKEVAMHIAAADPKYVRREDVPAEVIELSGFCIGCAEKPALIDPTTVVVGDVLIGYASDSIHANGWSLVRRVLNEFPGEVTDEELHAWLKPTRLYHDVTGDLKKSGVKPKAMSHITGGGLPENLERLFRGMGADLEIPRWELPGIDKLLSHVDAQDRFHTFNMGIGWVAIVAEADVGAAIKAGPGGHVIGRMVPAEGVRVRVKGE
jgi:phosphoribosylaminoimidazole (AIR) synthetase